jgi:hypothetical protein
VESNYEKESLPLLFFFKEYLKRAILPKLAATQDQILADAQTTE